MQETLPVSERAVREAQLHGRLAPFAFGMEADPSVDGETVVSDRREARRAESGSPEQHARPPPPACRSHLARASFGSRHEGVAGEVAGQSLGQAARIL
jgi:hypothetical protein